MLGHARHLIAGEWLDTAERGESLDPSYGRLVGTYAPGSAELLDQAVAAARDAFERGGWAASPRRRAQALLDIADAIADRQDDLLAIAVAETGKLKREIGHELAATVSEARYYAGLARAIFGRVQEIDEGALSIYLREPAGVAGIIVPWNAPITLLMRSLAPALAAGCTTVIKPAPQTALTNALIMEILDGVPSLPKGVVNAVNEQGMTVGKAMSEHPDIDVISFTGSCNTGKKIMAAASGTLKRLSLELGGKSPSIVFPDADLDAATATIVRGAMVMAGQMCTAISRVLVHDEVYDAMRARLAGALGAMRVGPADLDASDMGPVIDQANRERVSRFLDLVGEGGEIVLRGGIPADAPKEGSFLTPTLVAIDDTGHPLVQQELFGPFLVLERFADEAEAAGKANATVYGLAASLWTRDRDRAQRLARALRFGTVWINAHNRLFAEAETGGFKQSGFGRLHGLEGLNDFLETKHVYAEAGWLSADGRPPA